MAATKPIVKDQRNVITLQCAKDWHKAFKVQNKKGFASGEFPNSIVIPFVDIEQIVHDFKQIVHEQVNGVRVYFIIKPTRKANGNPNISCICVPTIGPHGIDPDVTYTDMVVKAELKAGAPVNPDCPGVNLDTNRARIAVDAADSDDLDEGYVSVYDVTRPCPPYCDHDSPINGEE